MRSTARGDRAPTGGVGGSFKGGQWGAGFSAYTRMSQVLLSYPTCDTMVCFVFFCFFFRFSSKPNAHKLTTARNILLRELLATAARMPSSTIVSSGSVHGQHLPTDTPLLAEGGVRIPV